MGFTKGKLELVNKCIKWIKQLENLYTTGVVGQLIRICLQKEGKI